MNAPEGLCLEVAQREIDRTMAGLADDLVPTPRPVDKPTLESAVDQLAMGFIENLREFAEKKGLDPNMANAAFIEWARDRD